MSNSPVKLPYVRPAGPAAPGFFPAMRYPNFRKWIIGASFSVIGTWMTGTALAWLIYTQTGRNSDVGLMGAFFQFPMAGWLLVGGAIADRVDKRHMLLVTQSLLMLGSTVLMVCSILGWTYPWLLLGFAAVRGSLMGFDMPARHSFVMDMVDRQALQSGVALNSASFNLGRVFGPALAGVLMGTLGPTWCFAIDAATYSTVLAALLMIRTPNRASRRRSAGRLHDLKMGLLAALGNRRILLLMAVQATGVFIMAYNTLLPGMSRSVFGGGADLFGYLSAAVGLGGLLGALTVSAFCRNGREGRWVLAGLALATVGLVVLALVPKAWMAMACASVLGFAGLCVFSPVNAAVQLAVGERYRGRVVSLLGLVFILAMPFGAMSYGGLADWLHPRTAITAGAVLALIAAATLGLKAARLKPLE